jgi:hypothetical protein
MAAALIASAPASAKDKQKPAPSPLVTAIDRCRQITDAAQRLACYDSAANALVQAANTGAVAIVDQNEIRKARRSLFGFTLPKIPFFSGDSTSDEAQRQLDSTIKSVRALNNGYYRIVIADDNAVWETSDSSVSFYPPRPGEKEWGRRSRRKPRGRRRSAAGKCPVGSERVRPCRCRASTFVVSPRPDRTTPAAKACRVCGALAQPVSTNRFPRSRHQPPHRRTDP